MRLYTTTDAACHCFTEKFHEKTIAGHAAKTTGITGTTGGTMQWEGRKNRWEGKPREDSEKDEKNLP